MSQVNKPVQGLPDLFAQYQGGDVQLSLSDILVPTSDITRFLAPTQHIQDSGTFAVGSREVLFEVPANELWLVQDISFNFGAAGTAGDFAWVWPIWANTQNTDWNPVGLQSQAALFRDNDVQRHLTSAYHFDNALMLKPGQVIGFQVEITGLSLTHDPVPWRSAVRFQKVGV